MVHRGLLALFFEKTNKACKGQTIRKDRAQNHRPVKTKMVFTVAGLPRQESISLSSKKPVFSNSCCSKKQAFHFWEDLRYLTIE